MNLGICGEVLLATMQVKPTIIDRIKEAQNEDLQLQKQKEKVKVGRTVHFVLGDDGILYHGKRICVPNIEELKKELMHEAHSAPYAMHPGSTKMCKDLKSYYWWP